MKAMSNVYACIYICVCVCVCVCVCIHTHTHTHTQSSLNVFDSTYFIIFCMPGIVQFVFYILVTVHRNTFLII